MVLAIYTFIFFYFLCPNCICSWLLHLCLSDFSALLFSSISMIYVVHENVVTK